MSQINLTQLVKTGENLSQTIENEFGMLSAEQLNWKPDAKQWSIAQCLEHLMNTNKNYLPILQRVVEGTWKPSFWAKISPFSKRIGRYVVKQFGPVVGQKFTSPPSFKPAKSDISGSIVADFKTHQRKLLANYQQLKSKNINHIIISSPALAMMTFPLTDCLQLMIVHEERHLAQAIRVKNNANFPKN